MKTECTYQYCVYFSVTHKFKFRNHQSYRNCLHSVKASLLNNLKYFYKFSNARSIMSTFPFFIALKEAKLSRAIKTSNLFPEYFPRNFLTAAFDLTDSYLYEITNSILIPHLITSERDVLQPYYGPYGIPSGILKSCSFD